MVVGGVLALGFGADVAAASAVDAGVASRATGRGPRCQRPT